MKFSRKKNRSWWLRLISLTMCRKSWNTNQKNLKSFGLNTMKVKIFWIVAKKILTGREMICSIPFTSLQINWNLKIWSSSISFLPKNTLNMRKSPFGPRKIMTGKSIIQQNIKDQRKSQNGHSQQLVWRDQHLNIQELQKVLEILILDINLITSCN